MKHNENAMLFKSNKGSHMNISKSTVNLLPKKFIDSIVKVIKKNKLFIKLRNVKKNHY